jgi:hypothetical protein
MVRPAGALLTLHEYGATPPLAAKLAEKGRETVAAGNFAVLIESAVEALAIDVNIKTHNVTMLLNLYLMTRLLLQK